MIRILVVDDHTMVRKGLIVLLENFDDIEVIGEGSNGQMAVDLVRTKETDVVLMDLIMPRMDGVEATQEIRRVSPKTQVVILTSFSEEQKVQDALKAGAISYMMKNVTGDELANAIRKAHEGQSTLAPEATQALIRFTTRPPAVGSDLTERELEVLALMAEGLNNREIAERLVISSSTVKNHVSNILEKLATTSRTAAVALAIENHIVR